MGYHAYGGNSKESTEITAPHHTHNAISGFPQIRNLLY